MPSVRLYPSIHLRVIQTDFIYALGTYRMSLTAIFSLSRVDASSVPLSYRVESSYLASLWLLTAQKLQCACGCIASTLVHLLILYQHSTTTCSYHYSYYSPIIIHIVPHAYFNLSGAYFFHLNSQIMHQHLAIRFFCHNIKNIKRKIYNH